MGERGSEERKLDNNNCCPATSAVCKRQPPGPDVASEFSVVWTTLTPTLDTIPSTSAHGSSTPTSGIISITSEVCTTHTPTLDTKLSTIANGSSMPTWSIISITSEVYTRRHRQCSPFPKPTTLETSIPSATPDAYSMLCTYLS